MYIRALQSFHLCALMQITVVFFLIFITRLTEKIKEGNNNNKFEFTLLNLLVMQKYKILLSYKKGTSTQTRAKSENAPLMKNKC